MTRKAKGNDGSKIPSAGGTRREAPHAPKAEGESVQSAEASPPGPTPTRAPRIHAPLRRRAGCSARKPSESGISHSESWDGRRGRGVRERLSRRMGGLGGKGAKNDIIPWASSAAVATHGGRESDSRADASTAARAMLTGAGGAQGGMTLRRRLGRHGRHLGSKIPLGRLGNFGHLDVDGREIGQGKTKAFEGGLGGGRQQSRENLQVRHELDGRSSQRGAEASSWRWAFSAVTASSCKIRAAVTFVSASCKVALVSS